MRCATRSTMFKMAAYDLSPIDQELCSQSTISRLKRSAGRSRRAADEPETWSDLRTVQRRGSADHAGHRRRARCGPQWSAVATVRHHYDEYGFRRSSCSMAGRFVTANCSSRQAAERQGDQAALPEACCARSALTGLTPRSCCGPTATIAVPRVLDWCRANDLDYILGIAPTATLAPPCCLEGPRQQHEGEIRGRAARRQASSFHGVLRRRAKLEPGRADHRRRSGREPDTRFVVTNLSENATLCWKHLRGCLLPARLDRKPYQVLEDPSGGGSPTVFIRRLTLLSFSWYFCMQALLADVGPTRVDYDDFDGASPSSTRCASASSRLPPASSR